MSLTDNLKDVAYTSLKQADKIVCAFSGSFDVASATTVGDALLAQLQRHRIVHGFTRPVFTKLQVSDDNVTWEDGGAFSTGLAYSDSTYIGILTNRTTGTMYYRVIGFWIDDYDTTNPSVPPTTGTQSDVHFDSRLNYQTVAVQETGTTSSGVGPHTQTTTHNLGYKPNARVFFEAFPGEVWPSNFGGSNNRWLMEFDQVECSYSITTTGVEVSTTGGVSSPERDHWVVVYYDE